MSVNGFLADILIRYLAGISYFMLSSKFILNYAVNTMGCFIHHYSEIFPSASSLLRRGVRDEPIQD